MRNWSGLTSVTSVSWATARWFTCAAKAAKTGACPSKPHSSVTLRSTWPAGVPGFRAGAAGPPPPGDWAVGRLTRRYSSAPRTAPGSRAAPCSTGFCGCFAAREWTPNASAALVHGLRHTFATDLANAKVSVYELEIALRAHVHRHLATVCRGGRETRAAAPETRSTSGYAATDISVPTPRCRGMEVHVVLGSEGLAHAYTAGWPGEACGRSCIPHVARSPDRPIARNDSINNTGI